jgi:PAS domain S-box-containing protein
MNNQTKTNHTQDREIAALRERIRELETMEAKRNRIEESLRESEERYREILHNVQEAYYEVDLNGNFTFFNTPAMINLGYSAEEMKGMNFRTFTDSENAKKVLKAYNRIFLTGDPLTRLEWELLTKEGIRYPVESSASLIRSKAGDPVGFRGMVRDVTDRKQTQEALQESEERYRGILEEMNEAYYEINLKGNFTFFNESMCKTLGYSQIELTGMNNRDYTSKKSALKATLRFKEVYQTGIPGSLMDYEVIRKDGQRRILETSILPMKKSTGEITGFRGVARDVTDRIKADRERRKLEERLRQADKMESIGTLAGGIAHDFNNLLMGIQGYASLALMNLDPIDPNYERLKRIEQQVQSGSDLTKQLLGFARGGRYEVKPSDMNDILEKTASMFGRTRKEITMDRKYANDLWSAEVDRGQMEQMLLNLYVNAWQAMPGGGEITVETHNVVLEDRQAFPYNMNPGRYVMISVTDTGEGIDEKIKDKIFDPFFTTKKFGRGAGLGLAMVYGIIKGHGGMINVDTSPGQGTTFNIYLPASQQAVVQEIAAPAKIVGGTETILVVDDEGMVLKVCGELLESIGYRVLTVESGQEALDVYMEHGKEIDLVILDMIMPGMSGAETFDRLRGMNPDIRVLLSSGYSMNSEAKHIMDQGCNGFLQKPFLLERLSGKVRELLD